jgi:hypothetical protein
MAFRGMEPIRSKICINNKTLKQQNTSNHLGYNISYEGEKDLNIKAANFVKVLGIINQIFKPSLVSRHTRIHIYKTVARTKRKKKFRKTFEKMEGFSFVTPITGLSRPNTGKEGDDDDKQSTSSGFLVSAVCDMCFPVL